jgi:hypothetical protein
MKKFGQDPPPKLASIFEVEIGVCRVAFFTHDARNRRYLIRENDQNPQKLRS